MYKLRRDTKLADLNKILGVTVYEEVEDNLDDNNKKAIQSSDTMGTVPNEDEDDAEVGKGGIYTLKVTAPRDDCISKDVDKEVNDLDENNKEQESMVDLNENWAMIVDKEVKD